MTTTVSPAAANAVSRECAYRAAVSAVTGLPYFLGRPRTAAIVIAACCFNMVTDPSWGWKALAALIALRESWATARVCRTAEALRGPVRQVALTLGVGAAAATCREAADLLRDRYRNRAGVSRTHIGETVTCAVLAVARSASRVGCRDGHRPLCRHAIGVLDRDSDDPLVRALLAQDTGRAVAQS